MDVNLGKYNVTPSLRRLLDIEQVLDREDLLYGLGFYPSTDNFRHACTPCDLVIFGSFGADGTHCGFLTDFGAAASLDEAPIVCVAPMNDCPTRVVARNLHDFLRLLMDDPGLLYNDFESEEDYLAYKKYAAEDDGLFAEKEKAARGKVRKYLEENFEIPEIENPYQYVRDLAAERKRTVSVQTEDGLGVAVPFRKGEKHIPFPLDPYNKPDPGALKKYFDSAPVASRLAFIRDLQFYWIVDDHPDVKGIVTEALRKMGLNDEAERLAPGEPPKNNGDGFFYGGVFTL